MTPNIHTLQLAIRAMQIALEHYTNLANDETLEADVQDESAYYVMDLQKAIGDLANAYDAARNSDLPQFGNFPTANDLLDSKPL